MSLWLCELQEKNNNWKAPKRFSKFDFDHKKMMHSKAVCNSMCDWITVDDFFFFKRFFFFWWSSIPWAIGIGTDGFMRIDEKCSSSWFHEYCVHLIGPIQNIFYEVLRKHSWITKNRTQKCKQEENYYLLILTKFINSYPTKQSLNWFLFFFF